jgi:uncharacterized protein DUF3883
VTYVSTEADAWGLLFPLLAESRTREEARAVPRVAGRARSSTSSNGVTTTSSPRITSLDTSSGELRLIEIKRLAGEPGTVALTPNEKRVAEERRDCYWLYVVTQCKRPAGPHVMLIGDPDRRSCHQVRKVEHYQLSVSALTPAASGDAHE